MKFSKFFLGAFTIIVACLATANTSARAADLDLSVEFAPATTAVPGSFVTGTVTLVNNTAVDMSGQDLALTFTNQYLDYVGNTGGFICTAPASRYTNTMTCLGGTIPAGNTVTLTFSGTAPSYQAVPTYGYPLNLSATLTPGGLRDSATIIIADAYQPDLAVFSAVSVYTTTVGTPITYTATVTSDGPLPAQASTLVAFLPDGSTQTWPVPALATGGSTTYTQSYTPAVVGTATVRFVVDPDNLMDEEYETNNSTSKSVTVVATLPDLTLVATQPSQVLHSSTFTQVVTVQNLGTAPAANIVVKDLAINYGLSSFVADHGFTCVQTKYRVGKSARYNPNGYQCSGGTLGPGDQATLTLTMTAVSSTGQYSHNISVDPARTITELSETNNSQVLVQSVI